MLLWLKERVHIIKEIALRAKSYRGKDIVKYICRPLMKKKKGTL
jgi:hypothetical protein